MKRSFVLSAIILCIQLLFSLPMASSQGRLPGAKPLTGVYGDRPLSFEPNRGQADAHVAFVSHGGEYTLFLTPQEAVFAALPRPSRAAHAQTGPGRPPKRMRATRPDTVRMRLVGANTQAAPVASNLLPGHTNYLTGSDASRWRTHIPNYARVAYPEVYPGTDLVYYGNQHRLEYDFVLRPHADPAAIGVRFAGAKQVRVDRDGALHLGLARGEMVWHRPILYQERNGKREEITGAYRLCRDSGPGHGRTPLVRFAVGTYDPALPLVIDPSIAYSTLQGGSQADYGRAITIDGSGNAYVAGSTLSTDFPTTAGAEQRTYGGGDDDGDGFVTKFDHFGQVVFSTYFGGSDSDSALAITLSGSAICIAGETYSHDFPLTDSAFQKTPPLGSNTAAFVTALTADGASVVYSTYLGGILPEAHGTNNYATDITADSQGKLYITGYTDSDFPTTPGAFKTTPFQNAILSKLDITKSGVDSLVFSTYLGGNISGGYDEGDKIALDSSGNIYIAGYTYSFDYPTTPGAYETANNTSSGSISFLTKMNPSGTALIYSTLFNGAVRFGGLALDSANNAYVTGVTGTGFPATAGAFQTSGANGAAFVAKFNATGTALLYATYLGSHSFGHALAVDPATGIAYVAGNVHDSNFPTTPGAYSRTFLGAGPAAIDADGGDAFLTKINPGGSGLLYSTYLGGGGDDAAYAMALDPVGNVYLTGFTGPHATGPNFPTTTPALFAGGSADAFVTKISTARLTGLNVNPISGAGGTAAVPSVLTGQLVFDGQTGPADSASISSNSPAATVNPSVSLPEVTSASFPITLHPVAIDTGVTLSATFGGITLTTPLTVLAPRIASVAFTPSSTIGGETATGTVTLSGPAPVGGLTVTLTSGSPQVTVPATVNVPADAVTANFVVNTGAVATTTQVAVTAASAADPTGKSANLTLTPPNLTGLTLDPTSLHGGQTSTGTVTISETAPTGGIVVTLSSNKAAATVPASVTVAAGAKTATFIVNTTSVAADTTVTLTGAFNGQTQTATLTVQPPALTSLTVNPGAVRSFQTATVTVTLDNPAPTGGMVVNLFSSDTSVATLPTTVTVVAGARTATAPVTTFAVTADTRILFAATLGTSNVSVHFTVQPPLPSDFNHDGHSDLVLQHQTTNLVVLWYTNLLNITGGTAVTAVPQAGWQVVGCADINHDGAPDLFLQNQTTGNVNVWYLLGANVIGGEALSFQPGVGYKVVGIGDFNSDGKPDILFQQASTGQLVIWYMNGATVTGGVSIPQVPVSGYNVVGVGDFNYDAKPDIVFQNASNNQVVIWYMNGALFAGGGAIAYVPPFGWQVKAVEDINGDGKADLVFQNQTTNQLLTWFMDGLNIPGGGTMSLTPDPGYKLRGPR